MLPMLKLSRLLPAAAALSALLTAPAARAPVLMLQRVCAVQALRLSAAAAAK